MIGLRWFSLISNHDVRLASFMNESGNFDPHIPAYCQARCGHLAPEAKCTCGYYAWLSTEQLTKQLKPNAQKGHSIYYRFMPAVIWGYGRVIVHELGFRAQWLRILNLIVPRCICGKQMVLSEGIYQEHSGGTAMYTISANLLSPIILTCPELVAPAYSLPPDSIQKLAARYEATIIDSYPQIEPPDLSTVGKSIEKDSLQVPQNEPIMTPLMASPSKTPALNMSQKRFWWNIGVFLKRR